MATDGWNRWIPCPREAVSVVARAAAPAGVKGTGRPRPNARIRGKASPLPTIASDGPHVAFSVFSVVKESPIPLYGA